ncbi:MAG TPA: metal ABC transporter ATP-binding protein [Gammaproteobacteria bacterium]|nr:metal ABC transporter ATP-binding protein [Gammaproteobacteria bacterium]
MDKNDVILRVSNLTVELDDKLILENVSFDLHAHETLVILGPNGAGKTVLLRSLLGLLPFRGRVEWRAGTRIGYVPQRIPLNRELPVTVGDFFELRKARRSDVPALLSRVGITDPDFPRKPLGLLSSGQFQRVLIAWALMNDPNVLLFDEPTAGIDVAGEDTIHKLLQRARSESGFSMILVTHDLSTVYSEATHVLCIGHGATCYGAPSEILDPDVLRSVYGSDAKFYRHSHG